MATATTRRPARLAPAATRNGKIVVTDGPFVETKEMLGGILIGLLASFSDGYLNARWTALWTSLIVCALSLILWFRFDRSSAEFQFVEQVAWLPEFGARDVRVIRLSGLTQ